MGVHPYEVWRLNGRVFCVAEVGNDYAGMIVKRMVSAVEVEGRFAGARHMIAEQDLVTGERLSSP